jgi:hypothetical protein
VLERTACELQENEAVIIEEAHEGLPMVGCGVGSQHYMGIFACVRCTSAVCTGDAACTGGKCGAEHRRVQRMHGLVLFILHQADCTGTPCRSALRCSGGRTWAARPKPWSPSVSRIACQVRRQ